MIRIRETPDSICISNVPVLWNAIGVGATAMIVWAIFRDQSLPPAEREGWFGLPGLGMVIFIVGVFWFGTVSIFRFDLIRREIHWKRIGVLGWRTGGLSFDDVLNVSVARCYAFREAGGRQSYRVSLETSTGEVPIPHSYARGESSLHKCRKLVERVESILASTGSGTEGHESLPGYLTRN